MFGKAEKQHTLKPAQRHRQENKNSPEDDGGNGSKKLMPVGGARPKVTNRLSRSLSEERLPETVHLVA